MTTQAAPRPRSTRRLTLALALLLGAASAAWGMDPAGYVTLEIAAREATVRQLEARLRRLQAGTTLERELAAADADQREVARLFERAGTTPGRHAAWATAHRAELEAWLAAHPEPARRLEALAARIRELAQRIDAHGRP